HHRSRSDVWRRAGAGRPADESDDEPAAAGATAAARPTDPRPSGVRPGDAGPADARPTHARARNHHARPRRADDDHADRAAGEWRHRANARTGETHGRARATARGWSEDRR